MSKTGKTVCKIIFEVILLAICVVVAFFASRYMFTTIPIVGTSMEYTVHNGDTVLIYKPIKNFRYGDVVVFNSHQQSASGDRYLIKRIIGMPGDAVDIIQNSEDGKYYVYINGEKLEEDYVSPDLQMSYGMTRVVVPEGKFLYMGDNRRDSYDSRTSGMFGDFDDVLGLVIVRYQNSESGFDLDIVKRVS